MYEVIEMFQWKQFDKIPIPHTFYCLTLPKTFSYSKSDLIPEDLSSRWIHFNKNNEKMIISLSLLDTLQN